MGMQWAGVSDQLPTLQKSVEGVEWYKLLFLH